MANSDQAKRRNTTAQEKPYTFPSRIEGLPLQAPSRAARGGPKAGPEFFMPKMNAEGAPGMFGDHVMSGLLEDEDAAPNGSPSKDGGEQHLDSITSTTGRRRRRAVSAISTSPSPGPFETRVIPLTLDDDDDDAAPTSSPSRDARDRFLSNISSNDGRKAGPALPRTSSPFIIPEALQDVIKEAVRSEVANGMATVKSDIRKILQEVWDEVVHRENAKAVNFDEHLKKLIDNRFEQDERRADGGMGRDGESPRAKNTSTPVSPRSLLPREADASGSLKRKLVSWRGPRSKLKLELILFV